MFYRDMEARGSKGKARRCGAPPPNTSHQFPDLNPTPPTTFNVRPTFLPSSNQPRRRHQSTPSRLPLPSAAFRRDPHPAGKPLLLPPFPRSNALPPAPPGCSVSPSLVVVPLYYQLVPMRVPYAAGEHRWRSNQAGERASLRAAASRNGFVFFLFFFLFGLGWVGQFTNAGAVSAANQNSGSDLFRFKRVPERDLCFFFWGLVESRNWGWWIAGSVDGTHCSGLRQLQRGIQNRQ